MRNPARRSRKIGLTQGGRVKDGRAAEKTSRSQHHNIWHTLSNLPNEEGDIIFITENPSADYYHPCTEESIRRVLKLLPKQDVKELRAVVFRRSSARDRSYGVEARRRYQCVLLYPFPKSLELNWGTEGPTRAQRKHHEPWCDRWEKRDGKHIQIWTPQEVRRYYRFHLLLHEIGHLNQPPFHGRTRREDFAENYALTWARTLGQLV
jgi:hypothetical protein